MKQQELAWPSTPNHPDPSQFIWTACRFHHMLQQLAKTAPTASPITVVVHLFQLCCVHCDGVIQASTSVALQILTIAVTAEYEGLWHKHAVAFGREHEDLQQHQGKVNVAVSQVCCLPGSTGQPRQQASTAPLTNNSLS